MRKINVIAEIANAHQGHPDIAVDLALACCNSGADAVKFQIYYPDELLTKNHPRYEHFKEQSFAHETWRKVFNQLNVVSCEKYADVFGVKALQSAIEFDLDGCKVHSSDLMNTQLLHELAYYERKVFLATGGSTLFEIRYALDHILKYDKPSEVILLHGFQAYPTAVEDSVLSRLASLTELFGNKVGVGYSDHVSGEHRFATILPLMAIPYGVNYIEKHVTFNRSKKGVDYYSSFEPHELTAFIADVELAAMAIGEGPLSFSVSEKIYRDGVKKSWTTTNPISAGSIIKPDDIVMKRTPVFSSPPVYEEIIGSVVSEDIGEEETIFRGDLQNKTIAIIVARSDSSRLAGKATLPINGKPSISHLFERIKIAKDKAYINKIAFCTTTLESDDELVEIAKEYPMDIYRGDVDDVLARMIQAVDDNQDHNVVLRITGDDILIDSEYIKKTIEYHLVNNAHYTDAKGLPSGTEVEVFDSSVLKLIHEFSKDSSGTEYLTNYIINNIDQFETASLPIPPRHNQKLRLTLDTQEDYNLIHILLKNMKSMGKEYTYTMDDIVSFFKHHPETLEINKAIDQKITPITINTDISWIHYINEPLVSVYIPNYNYALYVKQAIESVLNQSFRNFELIIIDDGSTDNSREIIEHYYNHPKVTIVYQRSKGLNITNNIATKLSKGKYIMRLDADDFLNENALSVLVQKLSSDKKLALVFPDYYLVDETGSRIAEVKRHNFDSVTMFDQPAHGACTMIRKDVLIEVGGYSEEYKCQDGYELWMKVFKHKKVRNVDLPLFSYRQHQASLTQDKVNLFSTRHSITKKYSAKCSVSSQQHLAIIPIRDIEVDTLALRKFAGTTLIDLAINKMLDSECVSKIVVTTPNTRILKYLEKNYASDGLIIDKRSISLSRINTRIDNTVKSVIKKYNLQRFDTVSVVNYEYPLRKAFYIDNAINALYLFEADSVLSVNHESANYYYHDGCGLKPFHANNELRLERDFVYKENGGIHSVKMANFLETGKMVSNKSTHIVLDDASSRSVSTDDEFGYLEYLFSLESAKKVNVG